MQFFLQCTHNVLLFLELCWSPTRIFSISPVQFFLQCTIDFSPSSLGFAEVLILFSASLPYSSSSSVPWTSPSLPWVLLKSHFHCQHLSHTVLPPMYHGLLFLGLCWSLILIVSIFPIQFFLQCSLDFSPSSLGSSKVLSPSHSRCFAVLQFFSALPFLFLQLIYNPQSISQGFPQEAGTAISSSKGGFNTFPVHRFIGIGLECWPMENKQKTCLLLRQPLWFDTAPVIPTVLSQLQSTVGPCLADRSDSSLRFSTKWLGQKSTPALEIIHGCPCQFWWSHLHLLAVHSFDAKISGIPEERGKGHLT